MKRSTREEWATRVARWKESGLSAAEYAAELDVNARTLVWWASRLKPKTEAGPSKQALARRAQAAVEKTAATISPLNFVEMTAVMETAALEVVLPTSVRIRVRTGFDSPTLGRLLDVLESRR